MTNILTIVNDTDKKLYVHGDYVIGLYPSTQYTLLLNRTLEISLDKYKKKVLGYVPIETVPNIIYLSKIIKVPTSSINSFVTGKSGCSHNDFSQKYGITKPLEKRVYLINDTPFEFNIFKVYKKPSFNYSPMILNPKISSDLAILVPSTYIKIATLIPGSKLALNNYYNANDYFEIRDDLDNCYGTFIPLETAQYLSNLIVTMKSSTQNYKLGKGTCNYRQYSRQYGIADEKNVKWKLNNNSGKKIYVVKVPENPIIEAFATF